MSLKGWSLTSEINFIFDMLQNKICEQHFFKNSNHSRPLDKLKGYITGLKKREKFDSFPKEPIYEACLYLKKYFENEHGSLNTINWSIVRADVDKIINKWKLA